MRTIKLYTILLAVLAVTACSQKEDLEEVQYKTATLSFSSGMSGLVTEEGRALGTGDFVPFTATLTDAIGTKNIRVESNNQNFQVKVAIAGSQVEVGNVTALESDEKNNFYELVSEKSNLSAFITPDGLGNLSLAFQRQCACFVFDGIEVNIPNDLKASFSPSYIGVKVDEESVTELTSNNGHSEFYFNLSEIGENSTIVIGGTLTICGTPTTCYYNIDLSDYSFESNKKYKITAILTGEGATKPGEVIPNSYIMFKISIDSWNVNNETH